MSIDKSIIIDWIDAKLENTCKICIYVCKFLIQKRNYPTTNVKVYSKPYINIQIVKYVINEILNCKIIPIKYKPNTSPTSDFVNKIFEYLPLEGVNTEIIDYLWTYVSFNIYTLESRVNVEDIRMKYNKMIDDKINELIKNQKQKFKEIQKNSLNTEQEGIIKEETSKVVNELNQEKSNIKAINDLYIKTLHKKLDSFEESVIHKKYTSNVFDDYLQNCIFQSIIYLTVTLTDTIETDVLLLNKINSKEAQYVLKILLPYRYHQAIVDDKPRVDTKMKTELIKVLSTYQIKMGNGVDLIVNTINDLYKEIVKNQVFINRVHYFAMKV